MYSMQLRNWEVRIAENGIVRCTGSYSSGRFTNVTVFPTSNPYINPLLPKDICRLIIRLRKRYRNGTLGVSATS
jgi:hypothetical protein